MSSIVWTFSAENVWQYNVTKAIEKIRSSEAALGKDPECVPAFLCNTLF